MIKSAVMFNIEYLNVEQYVTLHFMAKYIIEAPFWILFTNIINDWAYIAHRSNSFRFN